MKCFLTGSLCSAALTPVEGPCLVLELLQQKHLPAEKSCVRSVGINNNEIIIMKKKQDHKPTDIRESLFYKLQVSHELLALPFFKIMG